ncbi:MAG: tRNA pseudouridine(55) synthase TruB [Lachnospiraceae bacterium]|nr:tRNA pseudouridine(55) synthase TruB [Lachnospiraceae bacterium]
MLNGIINIYKERGFTSHDVVAKLRGILRQKKIGHTGTLDPEAEGVLPVCLGKGTRLCDMLADRTKSYEAVLLLGQSTDTQDVTGQVTAQAEVSVTEEQVREVLSTFIGDYEQIPPMYSALKVNGQRLYKLARTGVEVERKARRVTIYGLRILEICLPRVCFAVDCSKGTYIRTLCHDAGERLGCHGCMESLKRTRVGEFRLEDSLKLTDVERLRDEDRLDEAVVPVDRIFVDLPGLKLHKEAAALGHNGNPFRPVQAQPVLEEERVRVYDDRGDFVGVYHYDAETGLYRPVKMFYQF